MPLSNKQPIYVVMDHYKVTVGGEYIFFLLYFCYDPKTLSDFFNELSMTQGAVLPRKSFFYSLENI